MPNRLLFTSSAGGSLAPQTAGAVASVSLYPELQQVFYDIRWAVLFICVLIVTDFWSGLTASVRVRREDFRFSRALRRTLVKFSEYMCFIILGTLLAKAILEPAGVCSHVAGGALGAALALFCEADSIYGHVCDLHGIKGRFSLKRLFVCYIKRKDRDLGEAAEEALGGDRCKGDGNTDSDRNEEDRHRHQPL